jgi:hypothetical protein
VDYVINPSAELRSRVEAAGFEVIETPLTEFMKSGGAAKCLTLRLTEPPPARMKGATSVQSRELKLEGHMFACVLRVVRPLCHPSTRDHCESKR